MRLGSVFVFLSVRINQAGSAHVVASTLQGRWNQTGSCAGFDAFSGSQEGSHFVSVAQRDGTECLVAHS